MNFAVIISSEYLSFFLMQYLSFKKEIHQEFVIHVCCVDYEVYDKLSELALENVELTFWQEIANESLTHQKVKHLEAIQRFCWVIKPYFLKHLLYYEKKESVVYVDADLICFQSPVEIFDILKTHPICLSPHDYRKELLEENIEKRHGRFNGGLIGVNQEAIPFLDWWQDKCFDRCGRFPYLTPAEGGFDDQGYLDQVPEKFQGLKELSKKFNLGPWNVHQIDERTDGFYHENEPVVFYHFHQLQIVDGKIVQRCDESNREYIQGALLVYHQLDDLLEKIDQKWDFLWRSEEIDSVLEKLEDNQKFQILTEHLETFPRGKYGLFTKAHLIYLIASRYQKEGRHEDAVHLFSVITNLRCPLPSRLIAGAYYHLAQMAMEDSMNSVAIDYFQQTLRYEFGHQAAERYLKALTQEETNEAS